MNIESLEVLHDVLDINLEASYCLEKKLEGMLVDVRREIGIFEAEMLKCAEEKVKWYNEHPGDQRTARVEEYLNKWGKER